MSEHDGARKEIEALEKRITENKRALAALEAKQSAIVDARRDTKATKGAIRQGVKATVETVPMPVRLEVDQMKALKILAAMEGTTASSIIRGCIHQHLVWSADNMPEFGAAVKDLSF